VKVRPFDAKRKETRGIVRLLTAAGRRGISEGDPSDSPHLLPEKALSDLAELRREVADKKLQVRLLFARIANVLLIEHPFHFQRRRSAGVDQRNP
jgi:hypothetical protein